MSTIHFPTVCRIVSKLTTSGGGRALYSEVQVEHVLTCPVRALYREPLPPVDNPLPGEGKQLIIYDNY